jgi:hypothetical protein
VLGVEKRLNPSIFYQFFEQCWNECFEVVSDTILHMSVTSSRHSTHSLPKQNALATMIYQQFDHQNLYKSLGHDNQAFSK